MKGRLVAPKRRSPSSYVRFLDAPLIQVAVADRVTVAAMIVARFGEGSELIPMLQLEVTK